MDLLKLIAFFEQFQAANKVAGVIEKIVKDKNKPKEKKTAHLPPECSCESSYQQHPCHKYRNYYWSDRHNCNNQWTDYCHHEDWCHDHPCCVNKVSKNSESYEKEDDCKHNYFKKLSNEAIHNDQASLLSVDTLSRKRSCSCSRSPLHSWSQSCSCPSSSSYDNHHMANDDLKPRALLWHGKSYFSKSDDGRRTCQDNTVFCHPNGKEW